jgi:hypothetical protein
VISQSTKAQPATSPVYTVEKDELLQLFLAELDLLKKISVFSFANISVVKTIRMFEYWSKGHSHVHR